MTIQEALEGWFLHLRADNVSTQTLDRYARVWRQFGACLAARNRGNSRRAEGQLSVARKNCFAHGCFAALLITSACFNRDSAASSGPTPILVRSPGAHRARSSCV
jgi:hypothetical protein